MTQQTLTGSEKQITWATEIRSRVLTALTSENPIEDYPEDIQPIVAAGLAELAAHTEAKFWIDNRDRNWFDLMQTITMRIYKERQ